MIELRKTVEFDRWLRGLRDQSALNRIQARIRRLQEGNPGDNKPVGEGVLEMRVHCGPGYRIYFARKGSQLVMLLAGGDKDSQHKDISLALRLARDLHGG